MKKLWSTHSYTILLIIISCLSALFLSLKTDGNEDGNIKIKISSGDTLWELADRYSKESALSNKQFVNWVLRHNELDARKLSLGDEIILPVKNFSYETDTELASAIGE